jgi:uncharacterized protein (DUF433 family)
MLRKGRLTMDLDRQQLRERITLDPAVMVGKPVVRGTRVPVSLVLKHLADDLSVDDLLRAYPHLTREDVRACLDYASRLIEDEDIYLFTSTPDGLTTR